MERLDFGGTPQKKAAQPPPRVRRRPDRDDERLVRVTDAPAQRLIPLCQTLVLERVARSAAEFDAWLGQESTLGSCDLIDL